MFLLSTVLAKWMLVIFLAEKSEAGRYLIQSFTFCSLFQESIFSAAGRDLIELMQSMLTLDPRRRCSCTEALKMDYFKNKPAPSLGHQLPLPAAVRDELGRAPPQPGTKRKILDGVESSGLAKRLVF